MLHGLSRVRLNDEVHNNHDRGQEQAAKEPEGRRGPHIARPIIRKIAQKSTDASTGRDKRNDLTRRLPAGRTA